MNKYKHLWKPKESRFNWGTSEYKVIKNWTPAVERRERVQKRQEIEPKQPEVPTASVPSHEYKIVRNWTHREARQESVQKSQETEQKEQPEVPAASLSHTYSHEYEIVKNRVPTGELSIRVQDDGNHQSQEEVDVPSVRHEENQSEESAGVVPLPVAASNSDSEILASHCNEGQEENKEKVNTSKTFSRGFSGHVDMEDGLIQDSGHSEAAISSSGQESAQDTMDSSLDVTGHVTDGDLEPELMDFSETIGPAADKNHLTSDNTNSDCQSDVKRIGQGRSRRKGAVESMDARQISKKRGRTKQRGQEESKHGHQKNSSSRQIQKKPSKKLRIEVSTLTSEKDSEYNDLEHDASRNTRRKMKVSHHNDAGVADFRHDGSRRTHHGASADIHLKDPEPVDSGTEDEDHTRKINSTRSPVVDSAPTNYALPNRETDSHLSDSEPTASENDAHPTRKTDSSFSHRHDTEHPTSNFEQALVTETDAATTLSHTEAIGTKRRHQQVHSTGERVHELWIPKRTKRGKKDLNELDVCLSLYDKALNATRDDTSEDEVKKALRQHWKLTQQQMFTVIKDVQDNRDLVKKCKMERAKSNKLQKLLSSQLAHLRKSKEQSRKASARVSKTTEAEKMDALKAKIQTESSELRPLLLKLFVM